VSDLYIGLQGLEIRQGKFQYKYSKNLRNTGFVHNTVYGKESFFSKRIWRFKILQIRPALRRCNRCGCIGPRAMVVGQVVHF